MSWYQNVFELIDTRSFSNIWYWIALAVLWSSLSHFVLGVPFDMVARARRMGGQAMEDLETLVRININRRLYVATISGMWMVATVTGGLTMLALLGFWYGLQLGQALFLLAGPAALVSAMGLMAGRRIVRQRLAGEALCQALGRHRLHVQLVGIVSIFVTALWGMWQNMNVSALGG